MRQKLMVQMTKPVCHMCGPFTRAMPRNRKMMASLVALKFSIAALLHLHAIATEHNYKSYSFERT